MSKFTVITVCYNEISTICRCVDSVLKQDHKDLEYIVIDGGSTDGTAEYLQERKSDFSYFVSEKDRGIYHAMNKGIAIASGDFLFFLNANDYFYDTKVVSHFNDAHLKNPTADILYGKVAFFYSKDKPIEHMENGHFEFKTLNDFYIRSLQQQCFFSKRQLYAELGNFKEKFRICADYEWMSQAIINKNTFLYIPTTICIFDMNGISTIEGKRRLLEKRIIIFTISPITVLLKYFLLGIKFSIFQNPRRKK